MCYHTKFGRSQLIWALVGGHKKVGDAGTPPLLLWGRGWLLERRPSPLWITLPNLVVLVQTVRAYVRRSAEKGALRVLPFEVTQGHIETDTDSYLWSWAYLVRTVSEINGGRGSSPWNTVTAVGLWKTRMMPLQPWKFDHMCLHLDTIPQRDRQTDSQTEMVKQYRALKAMAHMVTRIKNGIWINRRTMSIHYVQCRVFLYFWAILHSQLFVKQQSILAAAKSWVSSMRTF